MDWVVAFAQQRKLHFFLVTAFSWIKDFKMVIRRKALENVIYFNGVSDLVKQVPPSEGELAILEQRLP